VGKIVRHCFAKILGMRLGTLLLRDGIITLTQLEQALRVQVLSGGRLGTNLVELKFIDLSTLGRCLSEVHKVPVTIAGRFEKADTDLIKAFGAEMANRYTAIPIGVDPKDSIRVVIALRDPLDAVAIAAIEKHLQTAVTPNIAGELRLFYYLEKYYQINRRVRYTRAPGPSDGPPKSKRERRKTQPFRGKGRATRVSIAPKKNRGEVEDDGSNENLLYTVDYALVVIENATHRNEIADAILDYSVGRFECTALFVVRSGEAIGWRSRAKGLGKDALERLSFSLKGISVFQEAFDTKKPYVGKVLTAGHSVESSLWEKIALDHVPTDIHVIPVVLANRVVNLIYAHSCPGVVANEQSIIGLQKLAAHAEKTYMRILSRTKAN